MNTHTNTANDGCPDCDQLNEYYENVRDGAVDGRLPQVHQHLQTCQKCQAVMRFYRSLDGLISKSAAPSDDFIDRILQECHRTAEDDQVFDKAQTDVAAGALDVAPRLRLWQRSWFRLAMTASLALLAGGVTVRLLSSSESHVTQTAVVAVPEQRTLEEVSAIVAAAENPTQTEAPALVAITPENLPQRQGVTASNIRHVGVKGAGGDMEQQATAQQRPLEQIVRHTWLVRRLDEAQNFLQAFDGQAGITVHALPSKQRRVIVSLRGIQDVTLQKLVDVLESKQWALISPMLPQPRQGVRVDFKHKPVIYTVRLVESNRPDMSNLPQ